METGSNMMNPNDELDKAFDIVPEEEPKAEIVKEEPKKIEKPEKLPDVDKDYQYQRAQLYDLVEKMQEAVEGALESAQDSLHPRAFEVALNGAKATAEVVEKLSALHKNVKDLEVQTDTQVNQTNTQNNVFVAGTTEELMKMLKSSGGINTNPLLDKKDK